MVLGMFLGWTTAALDCLLRFLKLCWETGEGRFQEGPLNLISEFVPMLYQRNEGQHMAEYLD